MGRIRVNVKLTNAFDDMRWRRGEILEIEVRSYQTDAVVDADAVESSIPDHILKWLGVGIRWCRVGYADGRTGSVGTSEGVIFDLLGRDTIDEALVRGKEVVIGKTVLAKLDLLADCTGQRLVPNPTHPGQPVSMVRHRRERFT